MLLASLILLTTIGSISNAMDNINEDLPEGFFHYFAYGSNLLARRLEASAKNPVFEAVGVVKGYKLEFATGPSKTWGGSAANIIPDMESDVYGVVWRLQMADLPALDRQEGVDARIYQRVEIPIIGPHNKIYKCKVYVLTNETRLTAISTYGAENLKPSWIYKHVILTGAKENKLPKSYIEKIERFPDNGFKGPVNVPGFNTNTVNIM